MATKKLPGAAASAQNPHDPNKPSNATSLATQEVEIAADDGAENISRFWSGNADTASFNARIRARSPEEALDVLQQCFGGFVCIHPDKDADFEVADRVEEAEVHVATHNMTVEDILEEEPLD